MSLKLIYCGMAVAIVGALVNILSPNSKALIFWGGAIAFVGCVIGTIGAAMLKNPQRPRV